MKHINQEHDDHHDHDHDHDHDNHHDHNHDHDHDDHHDHDHDHHDHDDHHHHHDHQCGHGCCCNHSEEKPLSNAEQELLRYFSAAACMPVVNFALASTKSEHLSAVALAQVHLLKKDDSIEQVKGRGSLITKLEERGLITLDYDLEDTALSYEMYENADIYRMFLETVKQAGENPEFLYNKGELQQGEIMLTQLGYDTVNELK